MESDILDRKAIGQTLLLLLLFSGMLLAGCKPKAQYLGKDEITNYQGKQLTVLATVPDVSIKGTPNIDMNSYRLRVDGLVSSPQSYTYDQVISEPHFTKLVVLHCVEGWNATILWEGVKIADLIQPAGVSTQSNTLIFHCADGYTTSLPLDYVRDNNILLAFNANGVTLPKDLGYPFMVVAENKDGYKWAMWVTEIELSDNAQYKGFWESQGYSNDATVK
jgi:DMSO/TMAO reductase YedYZ molybdopterin-dependent catalytic subunit